jgi:hypothetical protein
MPVIPAFSIAICGAMRHEIAELVAAIEAGRHRRLVEDTDGAAAVAGAREPLRDADGARQATIAKPTQLAVDQMIGNQGRIGRIVTERRHHALGEITRRSDG